MIKKTAAIFLALILAMCSMLTIVSAEPTVTLRQSTIPAPGEVFEVDVVLSNTTGLKTLQVQVTYDTDTADLLYCSDGGYFDEFMTMPTSNGIFIFWTTTQTNDNYSNGALATLTFRVSDSPNTNTLFSVAVVSATNSLNNEISITGTSVLLDFNLPDTGDDIIVDDEEDEGWASGDDDDEIIVEDEEDEGWNSDDDAVVDDDDEIIVDDEEEEVTTAATKETKATTTTKKTSATTTKATTTESQTTPETTTTEESTSEMTTPQTTPEVTTTPETTPSQSVSFSGDEETVMAQQRMASNGMVIIAVILACIAVAAGVGISIWKKGEEK